MNPIPSKSRNSVIPHQVFSGNPLVEDGGIKESSMSDEPNFFWPTPLDQSISPVPGFVSDYEETPLCIGASLMEYFLTSVLARSQSSKSSTSTAQMLGFNSIGCISLSCKRCSLETCGTSPQSKSSNGTTVPRKFRNPRDLESQCGLPAQENSVSSFGNHNG